jgi:type I restriction enzyme, S subunit
MTFPRYSAYKDSGVTWLGEVPEHWEVKRLKQICHVFPSNVDKKSYDGETAVRLCNYTDVYYNERIVDSMELMAATATTEQIEKFTLKAGDTIITKDSETADDIAIAAYVPEDLPGVICGYHLSMVRPKDQTCGLFVKRLFDSTYVKSKFEVLANDLTRVGLGTYALDNVEMPVPPEAEQTAIATFLDRETAKIDDLIAEQRSLTALLKEKRQAVISHAVTKGLNPKAAMKDSGVAWLGEVPGHWETWKLSHAFDEIGSGTTPKTEFTKYYEDGDIPWVNTGDLNDSELFDCGKRITKLALKDHSTLKTYPSGSVVIAMYGATIGKLAILRFSATVNQACCVFVGGSIIDKSFLFYCLTGFREQIVSLATGGGQPNISQEILRGIRFACPDLAEQTAIVVHLNHQTTQIDTLITETEKTITLLQERRSALISAAVTGKMDVRGGN